MQFDSDIALLGTGVAPLVAAHHLLIQGKSVLLLNPDRDFYLENSELSMNPLLHEIPNPLLLKKSSPEHALAILRPDFPGAIEFWSATTERTGFHDPSAPHVRQRGRIWAHCLEQNQLWNWEQLEDLYIETSDAGLNPQILEGLTASRRFPGRSSEHNPQLPHGNFKGLFLPKLCDVDVVRYRNGLLEFVRERIGSERILCGMSQAEPIPDGIRFHSKGVTHTAKLKEGMLVFWTPRLSPWILAQAKRAEVVPKLPRGVRVWEQWSLNSREPPDPGSIGMYGDMAIWADFEGSHLHDSPSSSRLAILRAGPIVPLVEFHRPPRELQCASAESFNALSNLCHDFLKWDRFSIHSLKTSSLFEWDRKESWLLSKRDPEIRIIPACDGPLVDVVEKARTACEHFIA